MYIYIHIKKLKERDIVSLCTSLMKHLKPIVLIEHIYRHIILAKAHDPLAHTLAAEVKILCWTSQRYKKHM